MGSPSCTPFTCDGTDGGCPTRCAVAADCAADAYCNSQSRCATKLSPGQSCTGGLECLSGHCVDGVCCNSPCAGGCDRCNAAGSMGTCSPTDAGAAGASPSCAPFLCNGTSGTCPTTCADAGQCAGSAACVGMSCNGGRGNGQPCSGGGSGCISGVCADGVCCNSSCSGSCDRCDLPSLTGTCTNNVGAVDAGCGAFLCGAGPDCPTMCTGDANCAPGSYCNSSICVAKLTRGDLCTRPGECATGNCVEGFCCDQPCSGNCQTCKMALGSPSNGTCGNVTITTDPKGFCGAYYCNGSGSCATTCSLDCQTECKTGSFCNGINCIGLIPDGGACTDACQCAGSLCTSVFTDSDADSYGALISSGAFCGSSAPPGYSTDNTDCCDADNRVKPGQEAYSITPRGCDGGFDFDCSGFAELQFTGMGASCGSTYACCSSSTACEGCTMPTTGVAGWAGSSPPACGTTGTFYTGECVSVVLAVTCGGQGFQGNCNTSTAIKPPQSCR